MSEGEVERAVRVRVRVRELERTLALVAHPEGGVYHEHHRAPRDASTAIYFLLRAGEHAAWHRLNGKDEVWHHYEGDVVELHLVWPEEGGRASRRERLLLGPTAQEVRPARVVPAGVWQAARITTGGRGYALVGATVAPGFHFDDWSLADPATLEALAAGLPELADVADARELLFALSGSHVGR